MLTTLQGQIERITFHNEENGFTIAKVRVRGYRDLVTFVGSLNAPAAGQILEATGEWTFHPKFGEQFRFGDCLVVEPASLAGIEKYLGSGLIKGIGPVTAGRIVKQFGLESLEIIENSSERLNEVEGIGPKRIDIIKKAWADQKDIRQIMIFLQSHGVSSSLATKIFKQYGKNSIRVVKENPYRLASDIYGIGFLTADKIGANMGFPKDSELRIAAGIMYVLSQLTEEGHVYYPQDNLLEKCKEHLDVHQDILLKCIDSLTQEKRIVLSEFFDNQAEGSESITSVYLKPLYLCEEGVAKSLKSMASFLFQEDRLSLDSALKWVQQEIGLTLADNQLEAVRSAVKNKVMVITGGPGTGKTTIIKAIVSIFSKLKNKIFLAAPTGRAAKRLSEATCGQARTIHRLLEFSYQKGGFQRNEDNQLNCDLLIVDEASMIDIVLMYHLLKALPAQKKLILVGDSNQLPSVGPGTVFKDVIESGTLPVVRLTDIFRQAAGSDIIVNAHLINEGKLPKLPSSGATSDFYFIEKSEPEEALRVLVELVSGRIEKAFGFDPLEDVQVLTPMNRGSLGVQNLNRELQNIINPHGREIARGGLVYRINDKVMQVRNNYDKEVFNGDIGRIVGIDTDSQEATILFDNIRVPYDFNELDELTTAYAVSIHKSQGSEYPCVVIPLLMQHYVLLQRNLLYTAVTRGKKLVVIVGSKKALAIAVRNDKTQKRYSYLKDRLKQFTQ
jgi:exodeoxyribonuclease V alpha subunit